MFRSVLVVSLLSVIISCSSEVLCPEGSVRSEGKCVIPGGTKDLNFELPSSSDVEEAAEDNLPATDTADGGADLILVTDTADGGGNDTLVTDAADIGEHDSAE